LKVRKLHCADAKSWLLANLELQSAVIKLKQLDHVNHERSVLAEVAGHPFITTLITTFSDHDSLYMLVG
jgi:hypothetical protein